MHDLKQIVAAVVVSFLTVAGAVLLLLVAYRPQESTRGMIAFGATLAAVAVAVLAANVWGAARRR